MLGIFFDFVHDVLVGGAILGGFYVLETGLVCH